jgi:hypothetical protein
VSPGTFEQNEALDPADERLLEELRGAAGRYDPPPARVMEAARSSLTWRTIDPELAALSFDSVVDQPANAVRSEGGPRLLTFEAPDLTVEVEVSAAGTKRQLVGQLTPSQRARIDIRHAGGITTVDTDDLGRFRADAIGAGPVSLSCHPTAPPSATPFVTEWISV